MATMRNTAGAIEHVRMRDLVGRKVKTVRAMHNGFMAIPAGTICTISGWWRSGVSLTSEPCAHCGVKVSISRVGRSDVVLVV